jgi:hypothetical protein
MVSVRSAPYIFFSAGCEIEQWQHVATELRGKTKTFAPLNASEKSISGAGKTFRGLPSELALGTPGSWNTGSAQDDLPPLVQGHAMDRTVCANLFGGAKKPRLER